MFIVEPQWNPSVEEQAVARALRIGQKQRVIVTRYYVRGTVEEVRLKGACIHGRLTCPGNACPAALENEHRGDAVAANKALTTYVTSILTTWNRPRHVVRDELWCRSI